MERANARAQNRMEATTNKRKAVLALPESSPPKGKMSWAPWVAVNRSGAHCSRKLLKSLRHFIFKISVGATWSCSIDKVHSAEVPQHCLHSQLQKLLARNSDLLVKMVAQPVFKSRAVSQLVSLCLLLYTILLARFYVLAVALLSIGVFLSF